MWEDMRILLLDDERRILESFSASLSDIGCYVKTASQPGEALMLMSGERFDIVFLDQFLGPTRGLDLMERMSEMDPELYYVIITGKGSVDLAVEALKKGASDFITKPFFATDLIKSIDYVRKKREFDREKKRVVLTLEREVDKKTEELKRTHLAVLSSLTQAIEKRDLGTYGHSRRVTHYCELMASALELDDEERHFLGIAAMLHDVGKIGISDLILGKPRSLTHEELQSIRSHPVKGVEILKPLKYLSPVLPAILHHHENYDGTGYPYGLAGQEIPLLARIIAVADTYDAILSNRPYRSAASHNDAIRELIDNSEKQFDPEIVSIFVDIEDAAMLDQAGLS